MAIKSNHPYLCTEFETPSFDKIRYFIVKDNGGEILKLLRGQFFMAHPLYYLCLFVAHAGSTPGRTKSTTKIKCGFVLFSLDFEDKD